MQLRFNGRVALITGGASGIGESCVRLFHGCGARVVIADKNVDAARRIGGELSVLSVEVDIGDEASVEAAVVSIEKDLGPIDILVNCAGVLQRPLPPGQLSMKEWDFISRVDLRGTYLCCASVGARMVQRRRGAIVNIASVAGMRSGPLHSYGPAKAGVISLTECLAAEWGPAGIRVNTVSPGFTHTPALDKGMEKGVLDAKVMGDATALGRLVQPDEIAAAVAFLASDLASGITGVNLPVDVGYLVATPWQSYGGLRKSAPSDSTEGNSTLI